jgi:hypothetical protein
VRGPSHPNPNPGGGGGGIFAKVAMERSPATSIVIIVFIVCSFFVFGLFVGKTFADSMKSSLTLKYAKSRQNQREKV